MKQNRYKPDYTATLAIIGCGDPAWAEVAR